MTESTPLPTRLGKSPLVEALFEIRFESGIPASSVLSGFLYTQLKCTEILRMPHADIPDQLRQGDPNLVHAPLVRLKWDQYYISLGDRNIVVSSGYPYSGWEVFKKRIQTILEHCATLNIIKSVERYSLKYLDIFDMPGFSADGSGLAFGINFPKLKPNPLNTHMKIEIPEEDRIHIVQYFGEAQGSLPGGLLKKGLMLDVDSIQTIGHLEFPQFMGEHDKRLNELHMSNKTLFFNLISHKGLESLEPSYE
ncbi:TIGR04255 family protein [Pseudomonas sp.]|uniref:TIGR04255 family protein n=1 Tax=Pseudomonas sp. TaxID=306 RepID=UPI003266DCF5